MKKREQQYYQRFIKEVNTIFPFKGKKEKEYLAHFQAEIEDYLNEYPDTSYEEMLEKIGTPKDVVESYFQNVDNDYLLHHMKRTQYVRRAFFAFVAILLVVNIYRGFLIYLDYLDAINSNIKEVETIIEEEDPEETDVNIEEESKETDNTVEESSEK